MVLPNRRREQIRILYLLIPVGYIGALQFQFQFTISTITKSCGIFIEFSIVHKIGYNNAI